MNKALVYIKQKEYEKALFTLQNGDKDDGLIHMDKNGKTAKEYAIDYCMEVINSDLGIERIK